jgi:hypothetical protein
VCLLLAQFHSIRPEGNYLRIARVVKLLHCARWVEEAEQRARCKMAKAASLSSLANNRLCRLLDYRQLTRLR